MGCYQGKTERVCRNDTQTRRNRQSVRSKKNWKTQISLYFVHFGRHFRIRCPWDVNKHCNTTVSNRLVVCAFLTSKILWRSDAEHFAKSWIITDVHAIGLLAQKDYCFLKRGFNKVLVYGCACMQPGYSKYFNFHTPHIYTVYIYVYVCLMIFFFFFTEACWPFAPSNSRVSLSGSSIFLQFWFQNTKIMPNTD